MPNEELPEWLDKTEVSLIGVLTMEDGEKITAEILEFDEERREVTVDVITPGRSHPSGLHGRQAIAVDDILSFDPQPRNAQPWPYSDPCQSSHFSLARFALMTTLFLSMTAGGIFLFVVCADKPYGIQAASAIVYTLSEVFLTFAATKGWRRYLFTCPAVRPQIPRLLLRHMAFLAVLVIFQTLMLAARPSLPDWWNVQDRKGSTPFELTLLFLCFGLGLAQAFTSRALIERAHHDFSGPG